AALQKPGGRKRDLAPGKGCHAAGEVGNGDLFRSADMIDAEVLAALAHDHHPRDEIIDVTEAARLFSAPLDRKGERAGCRAGLSQPHRELRNDVIETHVRAIDIMRTEDQHALEMLPAMVDGH